MALPKTLALVLGTLLALSNHGAHDATACTTILVGRNASKNGEVFVTHADDGEGNGDPRLVLVPRRLYAKGEKLPIFEIGTYPRYAGDARGNGYALKSATEKELYKESKPLGWIPQPEGNT